MRQLQTLEGFGTGGMGIFQQLLLVLWATIGA
jgi:hypothetical protein